MRNFPGKLPFAPLTLLIKIAFTNGGISFSRIPVFLLYVFRFILLEPVRLAEIIFYHNKIKSHKLSSQPIFILGHWRSGTSFFQNLMCQDPTLTSSNIYRSIFSDTFYLTEPWLKPCLNWVCRIFKITYSLQRMPMNLDYAAEADMALCSLCSRQGYTWGHLFPKKFAWWRDNQILFQNEQAAREWLQHYDYFIRKLSHRAKDKRVVIKSPGDTGRMMHLKRFYPDALFIYLHRDPFSLFQSNIYFWKTILEQNSLQKISNAALEDLIINSYKKIVLNYLNSRQEIPKEQLVEINFIDLVQQPLRELSKVYSNLHLGVFPENEISIMLRTSDKHTHGEYRLDSELLVRLKQQWGFAFHELPTQQI